MVKANFFRRVAGSRSLAHLHHVSLILTIIGFWELTFSVWHGRFYNGGL